MLTVSLDNNRSSVQYDNVPVRWIHTEFTNRHWWILFWENSSLWSNIVIRNQQSVDYYMGHYFGRYGLYEVGIIL